MPPWCARSHFHTHGESRDLLKHLSSKVDLLDYKAHDHNMIMHRERDEHIATGRTLSLEEELLPHHHGNQQRRWRWWWRSMEMALGAIPCPGRVPEQRLSVPQISPSVAAVLQNFSWLEAGFSRVFALEAS